MPIRGFAIFRMSTDNLFKNSQISIKANANAKLNLNVIITFSLNILQDTNDRLCNLDLIRYSSHVVAILISIDKPMLFLYVYTKITKISPFKKNLNRS
jgi:hypothetical protein